LREQQVVEGVTQGLSFKQIAKKLELSPSTVSNHLYRIYQKLNINNRSQLADMIQIK
jgi:DNA-binding NarL/FixJ family response regulator